MIRHRIDLIDPTPFKQKHSRIPPSTIEEVRKHIEKLLSWSYAEIKISIMFKCSSCSSEEERKAAIMC